jgi:hypothetical protein
MRPTCFSFRPKINSALSIQNEKFSNFLYITWVFRRVVLKVLKGTEGLKILSPKSHLAPSAKMATKCSSRAHSTDLLALAIGAWEQTGRESTATRSLRDICMHESHDPRARRDGMSHGVSLAKMQSYGSHPQSELFKSFVFNFHSRGIKRSDLSGFVIR